MMRETVRIIGQAIKNGSRYLPIRNHAAALASLARPKDYLGQVAQIYKDATRRWRYVKDPVSREMVSYSPEVLYNLVMGMDGVGAGLGFGVGDCDCITGAIGAQLESVGFPVRIAITAPITAPPGNMFGHVFAQANVPKVGWVTVDPVMHPKIGLGRAPRHSRIAFFNLDGRLTGYRGNVAGNMLPERNF